MSFAPQRNAHIALRVDDVEAARAALEAKGVEFQGDTSRHRGLPHGPLPRSRRQRSHAPPPLRAVVSRADLLERYEALPLPSTKDEHWRFTDLAGFDPTPSIRRSGRTGARPDSMLRARHGRARRSSARPGSRSSRRPQGSTFAPLDDHELLGTLVGADDKFTAQNAALWKHGLLVHVPEGRGARAAALRPLHELGAGRCARSGACSSSPRRRAASR